MKLKSSDTYRGCKRPKNLPDSVWQALTDPPNGINYPARYVATVAERLSAIPPTVWEFSLDWGTYAIDLDKAAFVRPVARTIKAENAAHLSISKALRKVAKLMRAEDEVDMSLFAVLDLLPSLGYQEAEYSATPRSRRKHPEVRVSMMLRVIADLYDGEKLVLHGLKENRVGYSSAGIAGAANLAFKQVSQLLKSITRKPSVKISSDIVVAYHPFAEVKDWGRSARSANRKPQA